MSKRYLAVFIAIGIVILAALAGQALFQTRANRQPGAVVVSTTGRATATSKSPDIVVVETLTPLPPWDFSKRIIAQAPATGFARNSSFEIAETLFRQSMEPYKEPSTSDAQRIIAYKIEAIDILNDRYSKQYTKTHPANFIAIAEIRFSIIPARYIYSDWMAGNGEYHPGDLWISNKSVYYAVVEKDGLYLLIPIGTSL
jgi:hypothetical protein